MINIFNRKEVVTTTDMTKYANAKDDLVLAGIKFSLRSRPAHISHMRMGKKPMRIGRYNGVEYIIYVYEKDYDRALSVIYGGGSK